MRATSHDVHFDQYLALVQGLYPAVRGLVAFDADLEPIWYDAASEAIAAQLRPLVQILKDGDSEDELVELDNGQFAELVRMDDAHGGFALGLCFCLQPNSRGEADSIGDQQSFMLLSDLLLADYLQRRALASKEDELNHMTDELTRRYEELNLIYKAEDQASNIYHGRELLRQLVVNTSRFLNVDIIYLCITGKNIAMHKFRGDNPVFQAEALFDCLRDELLPILQEQGSALVVNHLEDFKRLGIVVELPFKFIASPVVNADSEVIGLLGIASQNFAIDFSNSDRNLLDVMAKKASKIAQSHFDPLTGLENNNSFELILKELLKNSWGTETQHAIANIDIDRMAVVNDISGRNAGDQLIKTVGQTLAGMVRARDVVARIGSDKFGVLLENCDLPTARKVMQKISHAVSSIDLQWEGESHQVSLSIGIAPITGQAESVTSLLNAAETARNVSKERGRNSIHVLNLEDSDLLQRKEQIRWVGRIQSALRDDRFVLYAQLIQPLRPSSDKPHYEILVRMIDDDGSPIPPGNFLPAAENFYLMASLDYWVINQAFRQLSEHGRDADGCRVSINLSGQSLNDPTGFGAYIENKLEHYGLDARDICFEITESAAIANIDDARAFIDQICSLGCEFSLDDFGTGLSSFAYLKKLRVDYLKIDGGFVRDILNDEVSESMVAAINQVGHAMKLKTVAEFVENDAIRQKLARIGVDFGQGYGIGKPMPFAEISDSAARSA